MLWPHMLGYSQPNEGNLEQGRVLTPANTGMFLFSVALLSFRVSFPTTSYCHLLVLVVVFSFTVGREY